MGWIERNAAALALAGVAITVAANGGLAAWQSYANRKAVYDESLRSAYEQFYSHIEKSMNVNAGDDSSWKAAYDSHFAAKASLNSVYLYSGRTSFIPEYCLSVGAKRVLASLRQKYDGIPLAEGYSGNFDQSSKFRCGERETIVANEFVNSLREARLDLGLSVDERPGGMFVSEFSLTK